MCQCDSNDAMSMIQGARKPIWTYNRDFDVPRSKAQLGLFEKSLNKALTLFQWQLGNSTESASC